MSYTAYELQSGAAMDMVEAWCKQYTASSVFSTATSPTLAEVEAFLTTRNYQVKGLLVKAGYDPTQTDPDVVGVLQRMVAAGAVMDVELANPVTDTGEENERWRTFQRMWDQMAELLESRAFEAMGATALTTTLSQTEFSLTGSTLSGKSTQADDSDAVQPSFKKGLFEYPGSPNFRTDWEREATQT